MTQLSVSLNNAEIVRKGLQDLAREIPRVGREQIYRTMQAVVRREKEYWTINVPPELPSYQRTGGFAAGWFITPTQNGYMVANNWDKTKHAVGNAYGLEQAWMHARPGRFPLLRDVMEEEVDKLPPAVEQEITMVARRVGL